MENPMRGVLLLLAATLCFSTTDVMAKILGRHLPAIEIGWIRYITFLVVVLLVNLRQRRLRFRVRYPAVQVMRGVTMVASMLLFIIALRFLPLADAASVGFVSPLLITALSVPMLGEVVGLRRWIAIIVGFVGVLIVIRPGTGAFQPAAFLVLGSSLAWAFASIFTRRIAGREDTSATMLWTGVIGFVLLSAGVSFEFVWPSLPLLALNVALGTLATVGQFWMIQAYRHAAASLLAPFSYIQLIWATTAGYLVFDTLPDAQTLVGAVIIVGSGLYTIHRERVRARARAAAG